MSTSETGSRHPLFTHVTVLGAGVIGRSWAALFLAHGCSVRVYDPDPLAESKVRKAVESSWSVLEQLGHTRIAPSDIDLTFEPDPGAAVRGAQFIQESVPERIPIKSALYQAIEPSLDHSAIVATSASGLTLSELQSQWTDPSTFVLGHPFNPPHLIPLIEVMGNERTRSGAVEQARAFYESVGKVTIEVQREVPGHVANRLQAALWREAINLINEGVATVEDVDTAISSGPGLRWAVMGPTMLFNLGADDGGIAEFCERYTDSFNRWWDDLGTPHLNSEIAQKLITGIEQSSRGKLLSELLAQRDHDLANVVAATHPKTE